ncbi:MAG: hypothetical protein OK454_02540 [Thaumarchaeota archaeon]|nr:hypothetical protein [Nitrososphaerota archaeon]
MPSPRRPPARSKDAPKRTADERKHEREKKTAARDAEKERKRQEKERAKEERLREKDMATALAEVNKIRTDKKTSTPEMIVDLPSSLNETIRAQAETLLQDLGVSYQSWQSPTENVIKWRRKVSSRFNDELGYWEPVPTQIESEKHALVIVSASEFVELALGPEGADIAAHVRKMRRHFPHHELVYLVEGFTAWMRKNRNLRNRQFVSAVRDGLGGDEASSSAAAAAVPPSSNPSRRRRNNPPQEYIDEDKMEDALLELQILHGALIHHTAVPVETAQWIAIFTQHISTIPYRRQRDESTAAAAFCMETGQVRTGDGSRGTYVRMLQEIARVTAPIAYGVAGEFGTVSELVRGLEAGGPLRLEEVRKSANKDGAFSDRAVGQAVSRRIYKVFTGRDERSTDV